MDPATLAAATLTVLTPYLVKVGEKLAEEIGGSIPENAGKLWKTTAQKFKGKPAAEEAMKDLARNSSDEDTQAAFRKELKKALNEDAEFMHLLAGLLEKSQQEAAQLNRVNGDNNVAVNIGGNVQGNIVIGNNNEVGNS
jgi:hypothetical protein